MRSSVRVLQIEDNPGDVALVREALRESGEKFTLSSAARLEEGIARLRAGEADIALLDLGLPDSKGIETFTRARAAAPDVPIIVFSGLNDQELAFTAVQQGAQDYLVKGSFDGVLLARTIRYAIGRWKAELALHETERRFREDLERQVAQRTAELEASHLQLRMADRLSAIGTLAAGLGHDMNNVLLPVRCRLDAVDAMGLPPAARDQVLGIRSSVNYLQQLADGLRLLALDPDDAEASSDTTQLGSWWEQVGGLLRKAADKSVRFEVKFESGLPPVAVPGHRLTQAILNLIVNAVEAAKDRPSPVITFWARRSERGTVLAGVTDNGRGMTEEVKRRAMEPFFTTKTRGLGTGLGLALVRGVASAAGGEVSIDSEVGKGTTITLELPAAREPGGPDVPGLGAAITAADPRAAAAVELMLRQVGYETRRCDAAGPGEGAALWALDPRPELLEVARGAASRGVRIVTLGPARNGWQRVAAAAINDPTDLNDIRSAVERCGSPPAVTGSMPGSDP